METQPLSEIVWAKHGVRLDRRDRQTCRNLMTHVIPAWFDSHPKRFLCCHGTLCLPRRQPQRRPQPPLSIYGGTGRLRKPRTPWHSERHCGTLSDRARVTWADRFWWSPCQLECTPGIPNTGTFCSVLAALLLTVMTKLLNIWNKCEKRDILNQLSQTFWTY